jgi:uncharacterized protein YgiM (DUF1202 family)
MQLAVPYRLFDRLTLGLVVLLVAAPITVLEVTRPSVQALRSSAQELAARLPHTAPAVPTAKPTAHPAAKPAPAKPVPAATAATPAAAAAPSTTAAAPATATTNSFVHLRTAKSVSSAILTDLNAGTVVQLRSDADATWQGVTYQGKTGYIYRAYLQYQPAAATP